MGLELVRDRRSDVFGVDIVDAGLMDGWTYFVCFILVKVE